MTPRGASGPRPALTLLEVLIALAIFLLSLGALVELLSFAGRQAVDAKRSGESARLARSKLAEVLAGIVPLQGQGETPFDEDPDYSWSVTADSGSLSGLWVVTVTVKHKGDEGPGFTLQQLVLDPTVRGSTQDTVTITGTAPTSSNSGGSSSGQSQPAAAAAPAAAAPAAGKSGGKSSETRAPTSGRSTPTPPSTPKAPSMPSSPKGM